MKQKNIFRPLLASVGHFTPIAVTGIVKKFHKETECMKKSIQYSTLIAATGFAGLASEVHAASSITDGFSVILASQNATFADGDTTAVSNGHNFNISFNSNYAGFSGIADHDNNNMTAGVAVNGTFSGEIAAYRFYNGDPANTISDTVASGGIIGGLTTTDTSFGSNNSMNLWTSTDPNGSAFSSTPDYTNPTTINALSDLAGTVDISNLSAGTIYFIYGGYRTSNDLSVTMSGSGTELDQTLAYTEIGPGDFANNYETYISSIDFTNEDGFTTISFDLDWTRSGQDNGRFNGIVVTTPIPEPSSLMLLGLSGLALLRRRR